MSADDFAYFSRLDEAGVEEQEEAMERIAGNELHFIGERGSLNPQSAQAYHAGWEHAEELYLQRKSTFRLITTIESMPVGYRTTFNLSGFTLGMIVWMLTRGFEHMDRLNGLYFTGIARDFHYTIVGENRTVERQYEVSLVELPLWKVECNRLGPENPETRGTWGEWYSNALSGGSDLANLMAWESCSIAKRISPAPLWLENGLAGNVWRTGGLSRMITEDKVMRLNSTFEGVHECFVFIPSGRERCIDACIRTTMHVQNPYLEDEKVDEMFRDVEEKRLKESYGKKGTRAITEADRRRRRKMYEHGYTSMEMKKVARILRKDYKVNAFLFRYEGEGENHHGGLVDCAGSTELPSEFYTIYMFKITDHGEVLTTSSETQHHLGGGTSGCLHAVCIWPQPTRDQMADRSFQKELVSALEEVLVPYFQELKIKQGYVEDGLDFDSIGKLVDYQNHRTSTGLSTTLIFDEDRQRCNKSWEEDDLSSAGRSRPRNRTDHENRPTFCFAYDLETVNNTMSVQDKVYYPFRREPPPSEIAGGEVVYEPLEMQIPFSAQWAPVNLTDEGRYRQRKEESDPTCIDDQIPSCAAAAPEIIDEKSGLRLGDVLLDDVRTEYGDQQLGKCVEDMLTHMAEWVVGHGGESYAYAFAHNGAGFDAYVVLQFCRFKITRVLKTSRGLLSLSIRVPVRGDALLRTDDGAITITLRDTRAHMPGSLAAISKSFAVPAAWQKLDFPITMMRGDFCYDPRVIAYSNAYGVNDVKSLAFIMKKMNRLIGDSALDPAEVQNKPPLCQFLTCMSVVKASTRNHFLRTLRHGRDHLATPGQVSRPQSLRSPLPTAVDIPGLRYWLTQATCGGRVNAYAKSYASYYLPQIIQADRRGDVEALQHLWSQCHRTQNYMQVLDVTSLYPFVQSSFPMPTGKLYSLRSEEECLATIRAVDCERCWKVYSLCKNPRTHDPEEECHRIPFAVILIRGIQYRYKESTSEDLTLPGSRCVGVEDWMNRSEFCRFRAMCPRKLAHGGLEYSREDTVELNARLGPGAATEVAAYSNVDLYWMLQQGMTFEIVAGFAWETSYVYSSLIGPAFLERIAAKKAGNKILSDFKKLEYNSTFGVTAQRSILESNFIKGNISVEQLMSRGITKQIVQEIRAGSNASVLGPDEIIDEAYPLRSGQVLFTKKKRDDIAEEYSDPSPLQIGCAVLSYARHVMNLIFFQFTTDWMSYTDTDSIACVARMIEIITDANPALINNAGDAPMGTLKNDHLEAAGEGAIVVGSNVVTKKVKQHIVLNKAGKVFVFNTFKGFSPNDALPDGLRKHPDAVELSIAKTILDLTYDMKTSSAEVMSWQRNFLSGVQIGAHKQVFHEETYSSFARGLATGQMINKDRIESFVPHGVSNRIHCETEFSKEGFAEERKAKFAEFIGIEKKEWLEWFEERVYPDWKKTSEDKHVDYSKMTPEEKERAIKEKEEREKMISLFQELQSNSATAAASSSGSSRKRARISLTSSE